MVARGLTIEEWRDIPNYDGYYQVSDSGRVRSVDRVITHKSGLRRFYAGTLLVPSSSGSGYLQVSPSLDASPRNAMVHVLVATTFHGPCPSGKEVAHHNGNKYDNSAGNLRYKTRTENALDKRRHGTHHLGNKTVCIRGHTLADPNLVAYQKRREYGYRQCKACYNAVAWRARQAKRGRLIPDDELQRYADASFARIVDGLDGRKTGVYEGLLWSREDDARPKDCRV